MISEISLQIVSLIYIFSLSMVYFTIRKYNFIESKIYKLLLIDIIIMLISDIICIYFANTSISYILPLAKAIYIISMFLWLVSFTTYIFIARSENKYESMKELTKKHPYIYIWIISSILCMVILVITQILSIDNNIIINLLYILGIIISLVILVSLVFNDQKFLKSKNWSVLGSTVMLASTIVFQKFNNDLSIIGTGFCLITLFQYFIMENPDLKYIEQLNVLKVKAEAANQAKTNFLANMSHEIRTPMNAIIGLSELMLNSSTTPASIKEDIKNINETSKILLEIVNNILDITKVEEGKTVINENPYNLADIIAKLTHMANIYIGEKPIKFDVEIVGNIPNTLMGDEVKVYQVLLNVVTNAVKYTKEGNIKLSVNSNINGKKDLLTFNVADTGIGIRKEDANKLFEKFERLDQEQTDIQGTGLGLIITKKLVELMGGKISFKSEYQKGTTFTIVLEQQIIDKEAIDFGTYKAKKVSVDEYFDGTNYNVLVVDDNLLNLKVAKKLLEKYKINVTSVSSGLACLNYTKNNNFDLIFLDHMMPDLDGIKTLRNLKQRASGFDTPVVVLTANAIEGSKEMYLREGFCDYLSKPIDSVELDRILREQLKIDDNNNNNVTENSQEQS
mgnify:CR=1 FL=1